jgi:hypothetical protein
MISMNASPMIHNQQEHSQYAWVTPQPTDRQTGHPLPNTVPTKLIGGRLSSTIRNAKACPKLVHHLVGDGQNHAGNFWIRVTTKSGTAAFRPDTTPVSGRNSAS